MSHAECFFSHRGNRGTEVFSFTQNYFYHAEARRIFEFREELFLELRRIYRVDGVFSHTEETEVQSFFHAEGFFTLRRGGF